MNVVHEMHPQRRTQKVPWPSAKRWMLWIENALVHWVFYASLIWLEKGLEHKVTVFSSLGELYKWGGGSRCTEAVLSLITTSCMYCRCTSANPLQKAMSRRKGGAFKWKCQVLYDDCWLSPCTVKPGLYYKYYTCTINWLFSVHVTCTKLSINKAWIPPPPSH